MQDSHNIDLKNIITTEADIFTSPYVAKLGLKANWGEGNLKEFEDWPWYGVVTALGSD